MGQNSASALPVMPWSMKRIVQSLRVPSQNTIVAAGDGSCTCRWWLLPPPPHVHPPLGGGNRHRLVPKKNNATVSYCTGLHNCESSLLELMRTSFVLTHCTPQTSQNVP